MYKDYLTFLIDLSTLVSRVGVRDLIIPLSISLSIQLNRKNKLNIDISASATSTGYSNNESIIHEYLFVLNKHKGNALVHTDLVNSIQHLGLICRNSSIALDDSIDLHRYGSSIICSAITPKRISIVYRDVSTSYIKNIQCLGFLKKCLKELTVPDSVSKEVDSITSYLTNTN